MDLHYRREAAVGALVLVGVATFILGTMWLSGRTLDTRRGTALVEFADAGNLKRGNPVKVSGVTMGNVEDIRFQDVGRVLVTLRLDPRIQPRADATATISAIGLVGDVVVNFHPGASPDPLPPAQVISGEIEGGFIAAGSDLAEEARGVLAGIREVDTRRLADDLHATLTRFQRLADIYANQDRGPTAELTTTMADVRSLSRRMDSILTSPLLERALANADTLTARLSVLTDQFSGTASRLDTLLARVNRGEGTAGRIATDSTLYVQLTELSASLREFVEDLRKNPGKLTVQFRLF